MTTIEEPANARSRRTRAALLAAARSVLERQGFERLTMAAVAHEAGVTRRAVYLHFATRADLVASLFDHVAEAEGLHESLGHVWRAPDATAGLEEWARHVARYHPRLLAVDRAVERVRNRDPDAAAHRQRVVAARLSGCRRVAQRLADEGALAPGWTAETAADMILALTTSDVVEVLTVDRSWSTDELAQRLGALLRSTFLRGGVSGDGATD